MTLPRHFELARVTIELLSPATVGTGGGDGLSDSVCVTDASGHPAIPGTSIAGALRHALARRRGGSPMRDSHCRSVFGYQDERKAGGNEPPAGERSRLHVSWAHVHNAHDRPVSQLPGEAPADDEVLRLCRIGVLRDHVRIDPRGVVDGRGKFDERLVPAGARFTFEIRLDHPGGRKGPAGEGDPGLLDLLALVAAPSFRLGGRTRRGHGRLCIRSCLYRSFDLARREDREALRRLPVDLGSAGWLDVGLTERTEELRGSAAGDVVVASLVLRPEHFLLPGGGTPFRDKAFEHVDLFPYREPRIRWEDGRGTTTEPELVLPASSVKGALRHRVAFYAHVETGKWAGEVLGPDGKEVEGETSDGNGWAAEAGALVTELFGEVLDREEGGQPGRVLLHDVWLGLPARDGGGEGTPIATQQHVSLDRFTMGPMPGALFGEALIASPGEFRLGIVVQQASSLSGRARRALVLALRDLCSGELAVGAASSRGHGFLQGKVEWTGKDAGRWAEATEGAS